MLDFFKKQRISFYLSVAAAITALVTLIAFAVSSNAELYTMNAGGVMIFFDVVALLLIGFGIFANVRFGDRWWIAVTYLAALVIMGVTFGVMLADRVEIASAVFTYDSTNTYAWHAFNSGVVSMVFAMITALILTVSAFFKQGPKN